jgi:endo-1,4-beta-xylanase
MRQTASGADPYPGGLPPEIQAKLAARYGAVVGEIVRHPEVTFLGFWGTYDGRSRLNDFPAKGRTNHPLLFDRDLRDKPALEHVIRALARRPPPARPQEATLPRETPTSLAGRSQLQLR